MKAKTTRQIDAQGRISLPGYMRNAMKLGSGNTVSVEIDDKGIIHIQATAESCSICNKPLDDTSKSLDMGRGYRICHRCCQLIACSVRKEGERG